MKKAVVYMLVMTFVLSIVSVAFARTLEEEKAAVRSYLKVIDAKIVKYRKMGNKTKMVQLQGEKKGTLARWAKLQASMLAAPIVPPPVAAPVLPPPPVVVKPTATQQPLLGLGWNTALSGSYLMTGKGKISGALGARGDIVLDDMMGLASMIGLSPDALKYKVGLGLVYGTDSNNHSIKAIPLFVDANLMLPKDMMGGIETYVGGGLNYTLYGSGQTSGPSGLQVYGGYMTDLGLGLGKTGIELGYAIVRAGGSKPTASAKGITFAVSQMLLL